MDLVLGEKLDVIAYLPLNYLKERICGRTTYDIETLKACTRYQPVFDAAEQRAEAK